MDEAENVQPTVWVDADACPRACREVICRAARRTGIAAVFVANRPVPLPDAAELQMLIVASGMDVADNEIVHRCQAGDLVVTNDVPLAWEIIEKGGLVVTPRGQAYTAQTIKARLTMRDFMSTLRASGIETGGAPAISQRETHAFSNFLDRYLLKAQRTR